jgi:DNA-binding SARP family transcriptional activator
MWGCAGRARGGGIGKGDHQEAVEWWRRAAELNPFHTETVLQLARAWVAVGDRAAAMRAALHHQDLLRSELRLAADPRVGQLILQLRG